MIEVNAYLVLRYFGLLGKNFGGFWKNIEFELVFDKLDMGYGNQDGYRDSTRDHKDRRELTSAPP